MRKYTVWNC